MPRGFANFSHQLLRRAQTFFTRQMVPAPSCSTSCDPYATSAHPFFDVEYETSPQRSQPWGLCAVSSASLDHMRSVRREVVDALSTRDDSELPAYPFCAHFKHKRDAGGARCFTSVHLLAHALDIVSHKRRYNNRYVLSPFYTSCKGTQTATGRETTLVSVLPAQATPCVPSRASYKLGPLRRGGNQGHAHARGQELESKPV